MHLRKSPVYFADSENFTLLYNFTFLYNIFVEILNALLICLTVSYMSITTNHVTFKRKKACKYKGVKKYITQICLHYNIKKFGKHFCT